MPYQLKFAAPDNLKYNFTTSQRTYFRWLPRDTGRKGSQTSFPVSDVLHVCNFRCNSTLEALPLDGGFRIGHQASLHTDSTAVVSIWLLISIHDAINSNARCLEIYSLHCWHTHSFSIALYPNTAVLFSHFDMNFASS